MVMPSPEQYYERIRKHYDGLLIVMDTEESHRLVLTRPNLKLTIKGNAYEICPIVMKACNKK